MAASNDRLFARKPRRRRWLYVLAFLSLVILAHLYDPPLDPAYTALMSETKMPPVEENGYYALIGFTAPAGEDPHARGVKLMKQTEEWLRENQAGILYWPSSLFLDFPIPKYQGEEARSIFLSRMFRPDQSGDLKAKLKEADQGTQTLGCWLMTKREWQERLSANSITAGHCPSEAEMRSMLEENKEMIDRLKSLSSYQSFIEPPKAYFLRAEVLSDFRETKKLYFASLVQRARAGEPEEALKDLLSMSQVRKRFVRGEQGVIFKAAFGSAGFGSDVNSVSERKIARVILAEAPSLAVRYRKELMEIKGVWLNDVSIRTLFRGMMNHWSYLDDERNIGFLFRPNATKNAFWRCLQFIENGETDNHIISEYCKAGGTIPTYNLFGKYVFSNEVGVLATYAAGDNENSLTAKRIYTLYISALGEGIPLERMGAYISSAPPELWDPASGKPFLWDEKMGAIQTKGENPWDKLSGHVFYP